MYSSLVALPHFAHMKAPLGLGSPQLLQRCAVRRSVTTVNRPKRRFHDEWRASDRRYVPMVPCYPHSLQAHSERPASIRTSIVRPLCGDCDRINEDRFTVPFSHRVHAPLARAAYFSNRCRCRRFPALGRATNRSASAWLLRISNRSALAHCDKNCDKPSKRGLRDNRELQTAPRGASGDS